MEEADVPVEQGLDTADESEGARIERHASWAEPFFDLVAVAGVAARANVLGFRLDAAALGSTVRTNSRFFR